MAEAVLDASAALAFLRNEPGAEVVAAIASRAIMSCANAAEVIGKLIARGATAEDAARALDLVPCVIVGIDVEMGLAAGRLASRTIPRGLSLGDRLCIALAQREGLPVLTTDRPWAELDLGVDVRLIR
ncbi:MAG: type II toxin-antitoxin system VapC family toxin [Proteobacteria bacterium]|nr:type II toxin-antitoxin system VapC family toxin [Pseudomonadota bacterium]